MVAFAFALSGSRLGAEDLSHEAFLAAFRNWDHVASLDQPVAWVRRVVANHSASAFRRRNAEVKAISRAILLPRWNASTWSKDSESTLEVWEEVARLPRRQAETIALHYLAGLTMPEIAETLGCSKETVNTHIRRARKTLARRLNVEET